jgi:adenine deaminase
MIRPPQAIGGPVPANADATATKFALRIGFQGPSRYCQTARLAQDTWPCAEIKLAVTLYGVNARWLAVARGDEPADLVIRGGRVFSVFTKDWLRTAVAIVDGHVVGLGEYEGHQHIDAGGAYLVPGFIDAHVHIESSKLMLDQFSRAVLPHGTTAVVADPHEIANVLGTDGVHWLLDACEEIPLDVFVMAPSCVPASPLESPHRPFNLGDLEGLLRRHRTIGVAEMMNFPGVIAGQQGELGKLQTGLTEHIDGHAPGVRGRPLNAYVAAGIYSDHECSTYEEALEKRHLGMWVMLREGSAARNLVDLLPLVKQHGPERCMFCTDDREPVSLVEEGHIDQMVRIAVEHGVSPADALVMATLHPAQYHGLRHLGAIAPGYQADILLLDDLRSFKPRLVLKKGAEPVHRPVETPEWVRRSVNIAPIDEAHFEVKGPARRIRVMGVVPGQLVTGCELMEPTTRDGRLVADVARDLVKIAVVERHHATGRVGVGFATHVGLQRGAFASTVAHDAHNIVVLGVDDADMTRCVRRLAEIGGGIVVVEGGEVKGELPLPVAGLMSDAPLAEVHTRLAAMERVLHANGVAWDAPFMCLSFLALSVIPELKITDRGLVDVGRSQVVPLAVD